MSRRAALNSSFNVEDPARDAILAIFDVEPNVQPAREKPFVTSADLADLVATRMRLPINKALHMDIARALKKLNVTKAIRDNERGYYGMRRRLTTSLTTSQG